MTMSAGSWHHIITNIIIVIVIGVTACIHTAVSGHGKHIAMFMAATWCPFLIWLHEKEGDHEMAIIITSNRLNPCSLKAQGGKSGMVSYTTHS